MFRIHCYIGKLIPSTLNRLDKENLDDER
jgi:hypothetical protein